MKSINMNGDLLLLNPPLVMAVLNSTPDSFYNESRIANESSLLTRIERMISEGVDIIDIGGCSSRPNSKRITADTELERTKWVIECIKQNFPQIILSIDTYNSEVAEKSIKAGVSIINDISGGSIDKEMFRTIATLQCPYILSHYIPSFSQINEILFIEDIIPNMIRYFLEKILYLRKLKIRDIILDVGIGFSKNIDNNFEIIKNLDVFKSFDLPIMIGVSRKSMIYNTLKNNTADALNGTSVLNTIAVMKGANILRVHDVEPAQEVIKLCSKIF